MHKTSFLAFSLFAAPVSAAELVLFEFDGCLWCEQWKTEVGRYYEDTAEGKAAPVRTHDIFNKRPADLKGVRPIRVTPTFVLVEDGKELGRIVGYGDEKTFWTKFSEILER